MPVSSKQCIIISPHIAVGAVALKVGEKSGKVRESLEGMVGDGSSAFVQWEWDWCQKKYSGENQSAAEFIQHYQENPSRLCRDSYIKNLVELNKELREKVGELDKNNQLLKTDNDQIQGKVAELGNLQKQNDKLNDELEKNNQLLKKKVGDLEKNNQLMTTENDQLQRKFDKLENLHNALKEVNINLLDQLGETDLKEGELTEENEQLQNTHTQEMNELKNLYSNLYQATKSYIDLTNSPSPLPDGLQPSDLFGVLQKKFNAVQDSSIHSKFASSPTGSPVKNNPWFESDLSASRQKQ